MSVHREVRDSCNLAVISEALTRPGVFVCAAHIGAHHVRTSYPLNLITMSSSARAVT